MVSHDQNSGKRRLECVFAIVPGWKIMVTTQGCLFVVIDMWIPDVKVNRLGYNDAIFEGDLIGSEDFSMHPSVVEVKVFKVHGRFTHEHASGPRRSNRFSGKCGSVSAGPDASFSDPYGISLLWVF